MPIPGSGTPAYRISKGVPAAVVRSYKEPLYDTDQILAAAPAVDREFFQRPIGQTLADGVTLKTLLHTNMRNAGQLGTPVSFDLWGFNVRLQKDVTLANYVALTTNGVFQFVIGTDTTYLTVPLEDLPSGVDTESAESVAVSPHVGQGDTDNFYRFDVSGQAIHINSTESFRVRISFPSGNAITGNNLVRVYLRGILYKGI